MFRFAGSIFALAIAGTLVSFAIVGSANKHEVLASHAPQTGALVSQPQRDSASAPTTAIPVIRPAAVEDRANNQVPTWLWGQTDLSPTSVLQAWHAYARTQGRPYDTAQELVDYAQQNPQRTDNGKGLTQDAWLEAIAKDPAGRDIAHRFLASGYLDQALQTSLNRPAQGQASIQVREAIADLRAFASCSSTECAGWTAILSMAPDHAVAGFGVLAEAARNCGGPQALELYFRTAEAFGAAVAAEHADDWSVRKKLALSFSSQATPLSCMG